MGERFTSPLPLSAWGSDPTCHKMHKKTHVILQKQCFIQTFINVPVRLISIKGLGMGCQKCDPCDRKCVENATPSPENAHLTRLGRQKCNPIAKTCVENAAPSAQMPFLDPPTLGRSVRTPLGERFTSPLPLSAWGPDPTCCKIHEKTFVICQKQRFTRPGRGGP